MNRALCKVFYSVQGVGCGADSCAVRFMIRSKLSDSQQIGVHGPLSFPLKKLFRLHGRKSLQVGFQRNNGDHGNPVRTRDTSSGSEEVESVDMSNLLSIGGAGEELVDGARSAEQVSRPLIQNFAKLSSFWRKESGNSQREGSESCQFIPPSRCQSSCGACCSESEMHHVDVTPHSDIARDKEYFATFLNRVPAAERKRIAQMAHLSNLAYRIATIEEEQLFRHHHYRVVTSSFELKTVAGDEEDDAAGESDDRNAEIDESMASLNPAAGYAMAATAASCNAQACDLLLSKSDAPEKCDVASKTGDANSAPRNPWYLRTAANVLRSAPGASADPGSKTKPAPPPPGCPCEWFACENEATSTLVIAIQGTETLAAWQANLIFEPTQFEPESNSGVMVHRGIYEAAKRLYEEVLPCIRAHLGAHKGSARLQFTGHSLGGSLAVLLSLMVGVRNEAPVSALLPVYTFGSPCIMCGGNHLLGQMGLPHSHIQSVVMHRDIVPRTFACDYPDHVAVVLKRVSGTFRNHSCLLQQRLIYAPMGEMVIMQPDEDQAPGHPLLPHGSGLYSLRMTPAAAVSSHRENPKRELQSAERAFLNVPHPLEILSDRGAYGSDGTISRDHDCRNYLKALQRMRRNELKQRRRALREFRRQLWAPVLDGLGDVRRFYGDQAPACLEGGRYQDTVMKSSSADHSPGKFSHFSQVRQKRSGPPSLN